MKTKWTPLAVALAAVLALFAFGCSSDDPGVVVETGASSDNTSAAETPQPTEEPSLDESFAHDDDGSAEHSDDEDAVQDEADHEATEPETADHEDEPTPVPDENDEPANEQAENGTIPVVMNEFGYVIEQTEFAVGSTVTFNFVNDGAIEHEAMFGSPHEQEEFHADTDHGGAGHHGDIVAVLLGAGESGSVTITFEEPGEMVIGCHLPGHWEAGMASTLTVA